MPPASPPQSPPRLPPPLPPPSPPPPSPPPLPPPPLPPPRSPGAAFAPSTVPSALWQLELSMIAAGSVEDFSAARLSELAMSMADAAGVPAADVSLRVSASSVTLLFTLTAPTADRGAQIATILRPSLADANAASSLLQVDIVSEVRWSTWQQAAAAPPTTALPLPPPTVPPPRPPRPPR
eukprot:13763-Prymnesium_polylepis.1